jgi:YggT family protein
VTIFVSIIRVLCDVFAILILLRVVVSWYSPRPTNILVRILHRLTEPVLAPLRRIIPRVGRLDFTPLVAIILIQLIYYLLL